jgi:tRNA 2-thiouridine synthesizing protein E
MGNDLVNDTGLDVDGFLLDGEAWSEELAFELAAAAGIEQLSGEHWAVVNRLREGFEAGHPDRLPQVRNLCSDLAMPEDCVTRLFGDPLVAWRIAGLPRPKAEMAAFTPTSDLAG